LSIYNPGVETNRIVKATIPKVNIRLKNLRTNEYLKTDIFCGLI